MNDSPYAQIILQDGRVAQANLAAARLMGVSRPALEQFSTSDLLERLVLADRPRLERALAQALEEGGESQTLPVCLFQPDGSRLCLDVLAAPSLHAHRPAALLLWIDRSPDQAAEGRLRQNLSRLQLLHEIDQGILSSRDEQEIMRTALLHLNELAPAYIASSVVLIDRPGGAAHLLAADPHPLAADLFGRPLPLDALGVDLAALQDGLPYVVHDLSMVEQLGVMQQRARASGVRSYLSAPLRWRGELIGLFNLASAQAEAFKAEHVQIAQEVADSLAVAIQEAQLRRANRQRQRETEVMRDVMAALASAGDLKQTLEALLVHLHGLIHYDRAGLFLVDENQRFVPAGGAAEAESAPLVFPENDPLVAELRRSRRPLVVSDAQDDPRFAHWPEIRSVHGWLGAPLLAGDDMLGFLSLGSLKPRAYTQADADTMAMFAAQVAQVMERAWLGEQSSRRAEELEVLSSITSALGQAERGENTLAAIVDQLARFFDAGRGLFLVPDRLASRLVVQAALDESQVGLVHPDDSLDDWLWQAVHTNRVAVLSSPDDFLPRHRAPVYAALLPGCQSAVVIPLIADETTFGLLCFGFEGRRRFSAQDIRLFETVAEMAAVSLRRAVMLEALEKQVQVRTQHLTTLYQINALAAEPLNLLALLEDVLAVTVAALHGSGGALHFLEPPGEGAPGGQLSLVAQTRLPAEALTGLEVFSAQDTFWQGLLASTSPLVIPDVSLEAGLPDGLAQAGRSDMLAYLGAPLRVKGEVLGVMSLFAPSIQDTSIEEITLFMTIADQIGGMMERARLVKQSELAAVMQERQRLARELHDSVTQLLYSQVLFSGAGLKVLHRGDQALAEQHLARIEQAAQQALKEMRLLVYELRPSNELDESLAAALDRRLNAVEKRTGINARLSVQGLPPIDPAARMALYRIAEEALNNTLKHAQASSVGVSLFVEVDRLVLEIEDDGRGFNPQEPARGGMGLANIHERAAALGGAAEVSSSPGKGTRVRVAVKLAPGVNARTETR